MNLTFNDLTVNFSKCNSKTLLSDWNWLIGKNKVPILITAFGEPFVQDSGSGEVFFLNIGEGLMTKVAVDLDDFKGQLNSDDFWEKYLPTQAVGDLRLAAKMLSIGEVYSYKVPPILGGTHEFENIEVCDIQVHFSILGQIHHQVKDLPYGTEIGSVQLNLAKRPWWKFWN
ncbi:T6SS immunity protein Tdi1 domain-containing protein [Undibacterium sp. Ji22W]|uniref:T6SS immunity protein Tdi1 domain-containing protein n=1 Tax=Undibacterium sp. Ji22W TaxID=3413038 RepID=UPI003BF07FC0